MTDRFTVSRAAFETHVAAIEACGRVTLRISDLASAIREESPLGRHTMAVTFDDGFADSYDAVSYLFEHGLRSTVYVTTAELGGPNRLTRSQVAELARIPAVEIGAHTVHHYYLDELVGPEAAREITLSKRQLEDISQMPIRSFAYPHGAYDAHVRRAVIEAGYESAVAVKNALSHSADDPFALARWTVTATTPAARIAQVLNGENVPLAWARERIRTRAYRTVRRGRRRLARSHGAPTQPMDTALGQQSESETN